MEPTHGLLGLRASQVSVAQPLNMMYHRKPKLSNEFLVVVVVYVLKINIILIALLYILFTSFG